jgi:cytochrome c oxidase subunit 2
MLVGVPAYWFGDSPVSYQLGFQDPATTTMEGIYLFNLHLLFVIIGIVLLVGWLIYAILANFTELDNSKVANFTHSNIRNSLDIFTCVSFVKFSVSIFSLLYSLDEISNPELTLKILGHQWYWGYEISDFNSCAETTQNLKVQDYAYK